MSVTLEHVQTEEPVELVEPTEEIEEAIPEVVPEAVQEEVQEDIKRNFKMNFKRQFNRKSVGDPRQHQHKKVAKAKTSSAKKRQSE